MAAADAAAPSTEGAEAEVPNEAEEKPKPKEEEVTGPAEAPEVPKDGDEKPKPKEGEDAKGPSEAPEVQENADWEEFSGLRIENRVLTKDRLAREMKNGQPPKRFLSFVQLYHFFQQEQRQQYDIVIIGVLVRKKFELFGGSQHCMRWTLSNLGCSAKSKGRARHASSTAHLHVLLRDEAYKRWKVGDLAASASVGSVFLVCNPRPVSQHALAGGKAAEQEVYINKHGLLVKLGTCPSLQSCSEKGCWRACNRDFKERICYHHLSEALASKSGRLGVSGGVSTDTAKTSMALQAKLARRRPMRPTKENEDPSQQLSVADQEAERRKQVALAFAERQSWHSEGNEQYIKSALKRGPEAEDAGADSFSRVPKLSRGMEDGDILDFDIDILDSEEKSKAKRMVAERLMKSKS